MTKPLRNSYQIIMILTTIDKKKYFSPYLYGSEIRQALSLVTVLAKEGKQYLDYESTADILRIAKHIFV